MSRELRPLTAIPHPIVCVILRVGVSLPTDVLLRQAQLGADIVMVLDQCVGYDADRREVEVALERTHQWAVRCREAHGGGDQALFGILQGGVYEELRERSASYLVTLDFSGYAIGGLGVGEPKRDLYRLTEFTCPLLPEGKPRYLMGVGSPEDLVECVARGIDLFDCALPTRVARNGALFTRKGRVNILSARFQDAPSPVDEDCDCLTCRDYSAAYLHHLFRAGELLALRLATIHNLRFVFRLMEEIRNAIVEGTFAQVADSFLESYIPTDEEVRVEQKAKWLRRRRGVVED